MHGARNLFCLYIMRYFTVKSYFKKLYARRYISLYVLYVTYIRYTYILSLSKNNMHA
ncbi:hypothetical protein C2G38_2116946 [Gigaspora rosea]|uniref:Uncharacterized protein n=1 Tax=Gigaspora rosea TaxID=44941 RepID=A0A397U761_9GLOM|nr:hypothetical protein C2G38_2116946 [Gigaspora rosea]